MIISISILDQVSQVGRKVRNWPYKINISFSANQLLVSKV